MATSKARPKSKTTRAPEELLGAARKALTEDGSVKLTALGKGAVQAELAAQLVQEGYEAAKGVVRKPLRAQLEAALENGAFIPLKGIAAHVVGATGTEALAAAKALVTAGGAKLVQRGTAEVLVPRTAPVMGSRELGRFAELAKRLAKMASPKSTASLLQDDFLEALREVLPTGVTLTTTRAPHMDALPPQPHLNELLSAVEANKDPQTGLSFVPKIVSSLQGQLTPEVTRARLLEAANRGLLELRPEGGIGRLSDEELSVCPPGPQGTRLSWARRTSASEEAVR